MNFLRNNLFVIYFLVCFPLLFSLYSCKLFNDDDEEKCTEEALPRIAFLRDRDTTNTIQYDNDIWIMDRNGCKQTQLTFGLNVWNYTFSPSGDKVCFIAGGSDVSDIYIMNVDGSNISSLTNDNLIYFLPIYTPDGQKLVFVAELDYYNSDIMIMDIDGENKINLTDSPDEYEFDVNITPSGNQVIFVSALNESESYLYIMDIDGYNRECITCEIDENMIFAPSNPIITVDEKKVVFLNKYYSEIGILKIEGENYNKIYERQNLDMIWIVLYTPTNNFIIFSESDGQSFTISYKYNLFNSLLTNLKETYEIEGVQSISYDENYLLYTPFPNPINKPHELSIYDIANDKKQLLTVRGDRYPKFQPTT